VFVNGVVWSMWIGLHVDIIEYFSLCSPTTLEFIYTKLWLLSLHLNLSIRSYCSFSVCHDIGFFFI